MAKIQQVSPDVDDSGPIFDKEPEQNVQNNDHYDVFAIDYPHTEQSKSVHNTYLNEQDAQNVLIESEDMNYDSDQINQNDEDVDLAKERELLASLIAKLKCEIDETKNRNTLLESSNKVLVEKLKSEIADFKNKNKSLTEANNKLSEVNAHLYADYKQSKDELKRRNTIEHATEMELKCAKVRGELLSNKMEHKRRSSKIATKIYGIVDLEFAKVKKEKGTGVMTGLVLLTVTGSKTFLLEDFCVSGFVCFIVPKPGLTIKECSWVQIESGILHVLLK
nr:hypothetical protein [Tanacetum cinerariifolium]